VIAADGTNAAINNRDLGTSRCGSSATTLPQSSSRAKGAYVALWHVLDRRSFMIPA
jgi:hypothetical protein